MKKIICLVSTMICLPAFADDQQERDKKLIRDLELRGDLAPEATGTERSLFNRSFITSEDTDEIGETTEFTQTRIIKAILDQQQSAQAIADELDLELVSGSSGQAAAFKVSANQNMGDLITALKAHPGVIDAKQERVVGLNSPQ